MKIDKIAVFCGSSPGSKHTYTEAAQEMGRELAEKSRTLIYGGSQVGCMGALADAALHHQGEVIGVIPQKLKDVEIAHNSLTELFIVKDMHERKAKMASLAEGFIALPGGAGTLEEWFEVFTWAQLGYHQKPCGLLNVDGFYDPLIAMLDHTIAEGFMKDMYKDLIVVASEPAELLKQMDAYTYSLTAKWE
ncbi:LOG family protein [Gracilibacillus alcaliphilus]|uniref:LOG family protein n=1 Tax=Gracilibacillus alcaliphilus TaxID=1401441 RepID=UPI001EF794CC|nr:TIGR00730 family Rossman fold protein [Gracilibacillus alcaliphilus]MBM7675689.1 uncharacterized protein (TIGR00730 family) [Gracilibacillus alcaliphilus]